MIPLKIPTNTGFPWCQSGAGCRPSTVCHRQQVICSWVPLGETRVSHPRRRRRRLRPRSPKRRPRRRRGHWACASERSATDVVFFVGFSLPQLGALSHRFLFGWEGSPTKIDYRRKGAVIRFSLREDLGLLEHRWLSFWFTFKTTEKGYLQKEKVT